MEDGAEHEGKRWLAGCAEVGKGRQWTAMSDVPGAGRRSWILDPERGVTCCVLQHFMYARPQTDDKGLLLRSWVGYLFMCLLLITQCETDRGVSPGVRCHTVLLNC